MTRLFERPGPRWFTIPAHRPFAEDLAQGLHAALSPHGPEALADALVLTPTRRGARTLADAFVRAGGGRAILPPQMRPLGDLEAGEPPFEPGDLALDLPAAIEPLRRRFELARLVKAHERELKRDLDAASALELADALGGFLDSLQIEEIDPAGRLDDLVSADHAEHWAISRNFLHTALEAWPRRLAELGLEDVSARRVLLLRRLAEQWDARPPRNVLVAAGSTGTAPATAALLAVVARAPQGAVVLPGLDLDLADPVWRDVGEQHPQGAMRRLLQRSGVQRDAVGVWPASGAPDFRGRWRRRIVNEALRPPEKTDDWLEQIATLRAEGADDGVDPFVAGLAGLSLVNARHEEEAATVAALALREALETPGRTAALVTPDQTLARRVIARLARWDVIPDSSAGVALAGSPAAVLARLLSRLALDPLDPVALLAALKHPYAALATPPEDLSRQRWALERWGLRGPRRVDWRSLEAKIRKAERVPDTERADALALAARLEELLAPIGAPFADGRATVSEAALALTRGLEAFAADEAGQTGRLWSGHGGEALSRLLAGLIDAAEGLPPVSARGFGDLLLKLISGETVRAGGATHPRLRILGAIEARTTRADLLVLAGLEEGVWPQGAPVDPFLSRPLRQALGLPPPDRRIGLAAHDFAQAACAPEVVLVHSERREGSPSVKSRWLWRLETLVGGAKNHVGEPLSLPGRPELLDWARALDAATYQPEARPAPLPPLEHRPREMAVTRIETLTRDPYAVWARDILKLYPLDAPDQAVDARARGTAIHSAFEILASDWPQELPPDAAAIFQDLYVTALREQGMPEESLARETALAREAGAWVAALEAERRADGRAIHVELKGELSFDAPAGPFKLTARADRIEIDPQGFGHILDFKTGKAPSQKEVDSGFSPQLTLTAAILRAGGFPDLGRARPGDLTYLEVTGRKPAGKVEVRAVAGEESESAAILALEGAAALIAQYDDPNRPYLSRTAPQFLKARMSDYDHLARVFEWSTSGDEGET
ncbi:MAG: double-strand break repair protein AddB [Phenylobacterium sp.]|nr:double-strand break repair protein AddB [Phenylobacterium sp.]